MDQSIKIHTKSMNRAQNSWDVNSIILHAPSSPIYCLLNVSSCTPSKECEDNVHIKKDKNMEQGA